MDTKRGQHATKKRSSSGDLQAKRSKHLSVSPVPTQQSSDEYECQRQLGK